MLNGLQRPPLLVDFRWSTDGLVSVALADARRGAGSRPALAAPEALPPYFVASK